MVLGVDQALSAGTLLLSVGGLDARGESVSGDLGQVSLTGEYARHRPVNNMLLRLEKPHTNTLSLITEQVNNMLSRREVSLPSQNFSSAGLKY